MTAILMTWQKMLATDSTSKPINFAKYRPNNIFLLSSRDSQANVPSEEREPVKGYSIHTIPHKLAHKGQSQKMFLFKKKSSYYQENQSSGSIRGQW